MAPKIKPQMSCDAKIKYSHENYYTGRCLCRCLDLNEIDSPLLDLSECDDTMSGDDISLSLGSCNKLTGFGIKDYAEKIRPWLIETKEWCIDSQKALENMSFMVD